MTTDAVAADLNALDSGAFLVPERIVRRVIRHERKIRGIGLRALHQLGDAVAHLALPNDADEAERHDGQREQELVHGGGGGPERRGVQELSARGAAAIQSMLSTPWARVRSPPNSLALSYLRDGGPSSPQPQGASPRVLPRSPPAYCDSPNQRPVTSTLRIRSPTSMESSTSKPSRSSPKIV